MSAEGFVIVIGNVGAGFRLIGPYLKEEAAILAAVQAGLGAGGAWIVLPIETMPAPEPEPRRRRSRAKKEEATDDEQ